AGGYLGGVDRGQPADQPLPGEASVLDLRVEDSLVAQVLDVGDAGGDRHRRTLDEGRGQQVLGTEAGQHVAVIDQVHRRRAQEGGDEGVRRIVVDLARRA